MFLRMVKQVINNGHQHNSVRCFSLHTLPEELVTLQKTCKQFAENELKPIASNLDKNNIFPKEQILKLGSLGLMSICVSKQWGGSGYSTLGLAVAVEEIAKGCGGTAAIVSIHNCLYVDAVNKFGTDNQKEKFLRPLTKGEIGCFALSEPDAGSDVSGLTTVATLEKDHYILNGTKSWVTSGTIGKAAIIFATIDKNLKHKGITAFLVPLPHPGIIPGKPQDKLGIRASPTCNFVLENVRVPKENVLGDVGNGFKLAMMQLDKARVGIAAQSVGIAQAALDIAVQYAAQRKSFGKPINEQQAIKLKLADMAIRLEAARLLTWRAAVMCDEPGTSTKESSMAKWAASEAAAFVTHAAIQVLGGRGCVSNMPAERYYRDAKITEIYGGITDIHRLIIGGLISKEHGY